MCGIIIVHTEAEYIPDFTNYSENKLIETECHRNHGSLQATTLRKACAQAKINAHHLLTILVTLHTISLLQNRSAYKVAAC